VPCDTGYVVSAFSRTRTLPSQLQHPVRDVEANGALNALGPREHDVACAAREIEKAILRLQIGELNQAPLPASILTI